MSQASKKSASQPAAKLASSAANRAAKTTYAAVESTRNSAENVIKIGSQAVKDFMTNSAGEAQKAQEKAFALGRESAENFAKSADTVTKALYESVSTSRDSVETCIECGNMTASFARDLSSDLMEYANQSFSDNMEASKELLSCRTLNDIFALQNKIVKNSIDRFFSESVALSEKIFEYSSEVLEPLNERMANASDKLSKALSN